MLAMRRESDNNITSSNNPSHSNYTAGSISGESNLTHLNYPHPIHGYSATNFSGYQPSRFKMSSVESGWPVSVSLMERKKLFSSLELKKFHLVFKSDPKSRFYRKRTRNID